MEEYSVIGVTDASIVGARAVSSVYVEVLLEETRGFAADGEQYFANGVNDVGLACVVFTDQNVEPRLEFPMKCRRRRAVSECAVVPRADVLQIHVRSYAVPSRRTHIAVSDVRERLGT